MYKEFIIGGVVAFLTIVLGVGIAAIIIAFATTTYGQDQFEVTFDPSKPATVFEFAQKAGGAHQTWMNPAQWQGLHNRCKLQVSQESWAIALYLAPTKDKTGIQQRIYCYTTKPIPPKLRRPFCEVHGFVFNRTEGTAITCSIGREV